MLCNRSPFAASCISFAAVVFFVASLSSVAASQILWHACHPTISVKGFYEFTALDSRDNEVFAAAQVRDTANNMWTLRFIKSDDGGQTWAEVDPGFGELAHRDDYRVVAIQNLDGSHIYCVSDSGYFIYSTNDGATWSKSHVAPREGIDVNFADSTEGILISEADSNVFWTSDGGRSWHLVKLPMAGWAMTARSFGHGKFRVFSYGYGSVYTTNNYWQTYDTTHPLAPQADLNHIPIGCKIGIDDTLYAHGTVAIGDPMQNRPFIARSTNGGSTWDTLRLPADSLKYISAISDLDRDTIIVAGEGALEYSISYDRGRTWIRDTMISDTRYPWLVCRSVNLLTSSRPIGLWRTTGMGGGNAGILIGEWKHLNAEVHEYDIPGSRFYPNPAIASLTVHSTVPSDEATLVDLLGREAARRTLDATGCATFNVAALPRGIYSVVLHNGTATQPIGRVAVVE